MNEEQEPGPGCRSGGLYPGYQGHHEGRHGAPIDVYAALDMTVPGLVSQESVRRGGIGLCAVPLTRTTRSRPG